MVDRELQGVIREVETSLQDAMRAFQAELIVREEGRVLRVRDCVAHVVGLSSVALEELVIIGRQELGLVLGFEADVAHVVLLGDPRSVREGERVRGTAREISLPVGEGLLGRIVDPLGRPVDGRPLAGLRRSAPHHRAAPQIFERAPIRRPLLTGVLAVDAMFPIGRGQRELILGDEGTGKTALALDVLLRQRDTSVVSIYVGVGRRRSEVARIARQLSANGGAFVVVSAPDDTSVGLRYLAPYAGCAIGEYFMDRGQDALIVYDDLSAHAVAWRELSLLMRRPPGREAYPGDVFYLHSRLLERGTQLCAERGGGSLTALPLARLESGRLSAYIPTNLISITDGQLVLSRPLFSAGHKPAIDAGLSVSRVGAKAQPQAISALAKRLRLDFAAFLELEAFARLGTRLEAAAERRIAWGRRVRQMLRGARLRPLSLFDEVVRLTLTSQADLLLQIPEAEVSQRADEWCARLRMRLPALADRIERDATLPDGDRRSLIAALSQLSRADNHGPHSANVPVPTAGSEHG